MSRRRAITSRQNQNGPHNAGRFAELDEREDHSHSMVAGGLLEMS